MTTDTPPPKTPKEARLAEALRANLRRRKQGRGGASPAGEPPVPPSDPTPS